MLMFRSPLLSDKDELHVQRGFEFHGKSAHGRHNTIKGPYRLLFVILHTLGYVLNQP